jgi:hypothetical protein
MKLDIVFINIFIERVDMSKAKEIAEYLDGSFTLFSPQSATFNANLADKLTEASNELRRLSDLNKKMLLALVTARGWHSGDTWRESDDPAERAGWDAQMQNLDLIIKEAKEQE